MSKKTTEPKKRKKKVLPKKKDHRKNGKSDQVPPRRPQGVFCLWVPEGAVLVGSNSWNPVPDPQDNGDCD